VQETVNYTKLYSFIYSSDFMIYIIDSGPTIVEHLLRLDWIVLGFTSPLTQYSYMGDREHLLHTDTKAHVIKEESQEKVKELQSPVLTEKRK